jgi:potassium efflux system protein
MDDFLKTVLGYVMPAYDVALAWIIDPANWVQVVLLVGAYVVGIGFGLQKIASNFVSGVILLLEGQATVGDYVELDGGEAGTIVKMTARAAILETFDGKWIVVPNEDFIVTWVINYSDSGSANRDEVFFP